MKRILPILIAILYPVFSFSQILNLDRTAHYDTSSKKKFVTVLGASFMTLQQTYSYIDGALTYDFTHFMPKHYILVLNGKANVISTGTYTVQNLGFNHLRFRDNDTRSISPEPFAQYQWNITLGLVQRYLLGCNARIKLYQGTNGNIYYGLGAMYENEIWSYNGVKDPTYYYWPWKTIKNDFYKSNQYIKAAISISDNCDLVTAIFLQNKIDNPLNYFRLSNYTTFNIRASKKVYFALSGDIAFDNHPIVPINNTIYSFYSTLSVRL